MRISRQTPTHQHQHQRAIHLIRARVNIWNWMEERKRQNSVKFVWKWTQSCVQDGKNRKYLSIHDSHIILDSRRQTKAMFATTQRLDCSRSTLWRCFAETKTPSILRVYGFSLVRRNIVRLRCVCTLVRVMCGEVAIVLWQQSTRFTTWSAKLDFWRKIIRQKFHFNAYTPHCASIP